MAKYSANRKLKMALQGDYSLPSDNQQIVRVLKNRGNNLHEVETTDKTVLLATMPKRFRSCVWVKRGDFVLVEPIEEGHRVKAEIVKILNTNKIKHYEINNVWPEKFGASTEDKRKLSSDLDEHLFIKSNQPRAHYRASSGSDCSSDWDEEDVENSVTEECSDESQDESVKDDSHVHILGK